MKLLWVSNRAMPGIKNEISFLCTRASKHDQEKKKKLKQIIKFLGCTIDKVRVIGANNLTHIHTCLDTAHTTQIGMGIHTGGFM